MRLLKPIFTLCLMAGIFSACTYETIPEPDACIDFPEVTVDEVINTECASATGSITLSVTGGLEPYVFTLQNGTSNDTGIFNDLAAGNYIIVVTDAKGCSSETTVDILNEDGLNITVATNNTSCGSDQGSINITATGGVEPYTFNVGDQSAANGDFSGLAPGTYAIEVTDAGGCAITQEVQLFSDVVFAEIKAVITTNCAVSNCHDGTVTPDLRSDQNIQSRANRIQARTGARSMPPGGRSISNAEIEAIACWVEDGANL